MTEVAGRITSLIREIEMQPAILVIERHSKPVALIVAADSTAGRDVILGHSAAIVESLSSAERELAAGQAAEWERS